MPAAPLSERQDNRREDEHRPARVVFDPFSDVRHLARDILRYRREVLALREFFIERGCTVLLTQEMTRGTPGDLQAEALVHGYLTLHQDSPEYGGQRRRLRRRPLLPHEREFLARNGVPEGP